MGQRVGHRPVTSTPTGCVVRGCAEQPERGALICRRHAQALWRPAPGGDAA